MRKSGQRKDVFVCNEKRETERITVNVYRTECAKTKKVVESAEMCEEVSTFSFLEVSASSLGGRVLGICENE